jgi:tRNA pseudouridine38-40 synthase
MPRYKLIIEYDGRPYSGWQVQPDRPSVQQALMDAAKAFSGHEVQIVGAGRTDTGVHAVGQVAHVDFEKDYDPFAVMQGLNFYLFGVEGNRVAVLAAERASDEFHARFSGIRRHYVYRIINRRPRLALEEGRAWHVIDKLDVKKMQQAANLLVGTHDFSSFRDTQCQAKSPIKTLEQLEVHDMGGEIRIITSARSFLHHQVRIMTGTLALVGKGKWSLRDIQQALEARDRKAGGLTAPPDGLYLTRVDY